MDILDRIRLVRRTLNLNQVEFAKRIGLTQTALSMIEIEKTALTDKNIKLICATFAIDEDWLRTGNGEMFGTVSPYEKELLTVFSKLTAETQEFILEMAQNLLKRQEKQNDSDSKEDRWFMWFKLILRWFSISKLIALIILLIKNIISQKIQKPQKNSKKISNRTYTPLMRKIF